VTCLILRWLPLGFLTDGWWLGCLNQMVWDWKTKIYVDKLMRPLTVLWANVAFLQIFYGRFLELFLASGGKHYSIIQWIIVPLSSLISFSPKNIACHSGGFLYRNLLWVEIMLGLLIFIFDLVKVLNGFLCWCLSFDCLSQPLFFFFW
jgi:hypothetical protein